jgi:hypothetical protein
MAPRKEVVKVTHDELQLAIRKFQTSGGIIQKLPDQKTTAPQGVSSKLGQAEVSTVPDTAL